MEKVEAKKAQVEGKKEQVEVKPVDAKKEAEFKARKAAAAKAFAESVALLSTSFTSVAILDKSA